MARRKNTRRIDPRYFMDEKIELTENQKQSIKTLLEQEIANGHVISENTMKAIAKKFGVPVALVAAIASGIGAVNTSADVSPATSSDTTEMPADAGSMGPGMKGTFDWEKGGEVSNTMHVDTKTMYDFGDDDDDQEPFKYAEPLGDLKKEALDPNDPGPDVCNRLVTPRGTYKPESKEELALVIKCQTYYPTERACKNLLGASGNYKPENSKEVFIARKCDSQHPHLTQPKPKGMLDKIKGAFKE